MRTRLPLLAVLAFAPLLAAAQPATTERQARSEPQVRRTVIEDDGARIDELRVRGAVRSISVKPKGPITTPYEVLPVDAGRVAPAGPGTAKGSAGQRVWRVLSF